MTKAIQQTVELPATPRELFDTYLDSRKHGAVIGARVAIGRRAGARFTAFGGALEGRNLAIEPGRMIVQAWRGRDWPKSDPDSILVLTFSPTRRGGRIGLVHANVPRHAHAGVTKGWAAYYWRPWRAYLGRPRRSKVPARGGRRGRAD